MSILNLGGPVERQPGNKRAVKVWIGIALLAAVLGIGSTLAANISINGGNATEFGQGVQRTVYCGADKKPITVSPTSAFDNTISDSAIHTQPEGEDQVDPTLGTFYLSGIQVSDIDPACSGVNFVISVYDNEGHAAPLQLTPEVTNPAVYWISGCPTYLTLANCGASGITSTTYGGILSSTREKFQGASSASLDINSESSFTIKFTYLAGDTPIATEKVGKIVIETQNDAFGLDELLASDGARLILAPLT